MVPALSWGIDITAGTGAVSGAHAASMFVSVVMRCKAATTDYVDCVILERVIAKIKTMSLWDM